MGGAVPWLKQPSRSTSRLRRTLRAWGSVRRRSFIRQPYLRPKTCFSGPKKKRGPPALTSTFGRSFRSNIRLPTRFETNPLQAQLASIGEHKRHSVAKASLNRMGPSTLRRSPADRLSLVVLPSVLWPGGFGSRRSPSPLHSAGSRA